MIRTEGMSHGYRHLLDLAAGGIETSPRGIKTSELIGFQFILDQPLDNLPLGTGRKLNLRIAYAEALQLIAGRSYPDLMVKVAPNFKQFTNGGTWFHGAYGPRLRYQIPTVLENLEKDSDSRQAVAVIWDHAYDGRGGVNDTPCTLSLQWMIRNEKLYAITNMRSNDVWWGLPYDVYQFTELQRHLALAIGVSVGHYVHQAASFHMYDRDRENASHVTSEGFVNDLGPIIKTGIGWCTKSPLHMWAIIQEVAEAILSDREHPWMSASGDTMRHKLHA